MSCDELRAYILPLAREDTTDMFFFIGTRTRPWPSCAMIELRDGDVIFVSPFSRPRHSLSIAEALFRPDHEFGPLCHFFDIELHPATCVLFQGRRYTFAPYYHTGQDVADYATERFRLSPACAASCRFPIGDLDVHGNFCPTILAKVEIPAIREGDPEPDRCDYFTLCDLRPLGHKPQILHSHVPIIHLPSLLADVGIQLPSAYQACVAGATLRGDHVRVRGHSTIVVYARLNTFESDDSSEHSWPSEDGQGVSGAAPRGPPPPAPIHAGNQARDTEMLPRDVPLQVNPGVPASPAVMPSEHSLLDVTLPEGHSWNSGLDELFGAAPDLPHAHGSDEYPVAPQAAEATPPSAVADDGSVTLLALVYAPEFLPEVLYVDTALPCGIDQLTAQAQQLRTDDLASSFPCLLPATPHLVREFAIFVSAPIWLQDKVVVLLDCSRINGCVFAAALPTSLSRESLLLAAKLPFGGRARRLRAWAAAASCSTPAYTAGFWHVCMLPAAPASQDLSDMLLHPDGWNAHASLQCPAWHPGSHFYLLTDGMPVTFAVAPGRREFFRQDVEG